MQLVGSEKGRHNETEDQFVKRIYKIDKWIIISFHVENDYRRMKVGTG